MNRWAISSIKTVAALTGLFLAFALWFRFATKHIPPSLSPRDQTLVDSLAALTQDSVFQLKWGCLRYHEAGLWELFLRGDPVARGAAHGRLMKPFLRFQERAFIEFIRTLIPSESYLECLKYAVAFFNRNISNYVADEYRKELLALSFFHDDTFNFIGSRYERVLQYHAAHDIGHALQPYLPVACSAFVVWDSLSRDGKLLLGRNFDFYAGEAFARHRVVQFVHPNRGYRFISVAWPGFCGVVSGLNEKGLAVTINASASRPPLAAKTPISLLTRQILQYAGTIEEAIQMAQNTEVFVSENILVASGSENKAVIIEKTPEAQAVFTPSRPPLVCTNHYQTEALRNDPYHQSHIIVPDSPYRWATLQELLKGQTAWDVPAAAALLRRRQGIAGESLGFGNPMAINQLLCHHAVIIQPGERKIWVAAPPFQMGAFVCYQLDSAFSRLAAGKSPAWDEGFLPPDAFLTSPEWQRVLLYRRLEDLVSWFSTRPRVRTKLSDTVLSALISLNPHFYRAYKLAGDELWRQNRRREAALMYKKALRCSLPDKREGIVMLEKIKRVSDL
ncbi:MAG: C45 family peptidase [Flavobacteriales bacterium]|nr:C45 family peptidase [Flavobacteriales bacterium]MDW8431949.1 C45 family peptidase [Flavobacteriales bacterium]